MADDESVASMLRHRSSLKTLCGLLRSGVTRNGVATSTVLVRMLSLCSSESPPTTRPLDQYKLPVYTTSESGNHATMHYSARDKVRVQLVARNALTSGNPTNGLSHVEEGCAQTDPLAISSRDYSPYKTLIDCELDVRLSTSALIMLGDDMFSGLALQVLGTLCLSLQSSFWMCLNIKVNVGRALSTKRAPQSLHALHGLEFITFIWLATAMVYNYMQPYIENVAFSYDGVSSLATHPTNNYSYLIDGLLALSALYTTYLLYGDVATVSDIVDVIRVTLLRFWRSFTPFCVLFIRGFCS
ncbi:hypothetical protein COOONC_04642 [Cooperia oncophora]